MILVSIKTMAKPTLNSPYFSGPMMRINRIMAIADSAVPMRLPIMVKRD